MVYLVVLLAMALVLGPVFWLRPSPAQKRQARVRMAARAHGLDVRLTDLPQTHRAAVRREDVNQGVVYRLPVFDPRAVISLKHRCVREPGATAWEDEGDVLPAALQERLAQMLTQMPDDAVAVELGPQGPAVFWSERGSEEMVVHLAAQLKALRAAMTV